MNKRVAHNKGKKELVKHIYYTDGNISIRIPFDQEPPEGFVRGRLKRKLTEEEKLVFNKKRQQTNIDRYGNANYNNMNKNFQTKIERYGNCNYNNRQKAEQTCICKYGVENVSFIPEVSKKISQKLCGHEVSLETKNKISNARLGLHLSDEMKLQKIYNTNKTYHEKNLYKHHKTKPEIFIENFLVDIFGRDDVLYSYVDIDRYPFKCDFYVPSEDLFIEVHAGWRHNTIPFDPNNEQCLKELEIWKQKSVDHPNYLNAIYQWTELDVKKLNIAIKNNLNFVRLYPNNIYFINEKPRELLEHLVEMYRQQDNQQPRRPIWS